MIRNSTLNIRVKVESIPESAHFIGERKSVSLGGVKDPLQGGCRHGHAKSPKSKIKYGRPRPKHQNMDNEIQTVYNHESARKYSSHFDHRQL